MEKIHVFGVDLATYNATMYEEVVNKYKEYEVSGGFFYDGMSDVQFEFPYDKKELAVTLYGLLESLVHEELGEYVSIYALDEEGIQIDTDEV